MNKSFKIILLELKFKKEQLPVYLNDMNNEIYNYQKIFISNFFFHFIQK